MAEFPRVQGECIKGCGETLFLGTGGYVTCSYVDCPDPSATNEALARIIQLKEAEQRIEVTKEAISAARCLYVCSGINDRYDVAACRENLRVKLAALDKLPPPSDYESDKQNSRKRTRNA